MNNPDVKAFFDEATFTVSYVVSDAETRRAVIIDPVLYQLSYTHHCILIVSRLKPLLLILARPAGLEPATSGLEIRCSIRLSYGRNVYDQPDELELLVGAERFELPTLCSQSRCATRLRHAPTRVNSLRDDKADSWASQSNKSLIAASDGSCYREVMRQTLIALIMGLIAIPGFAADEVPPHPYIEIVTTEGTIILELDGKQAPLTVGHILKLVDSGFYDGIIFHRVIPGFMAQTGGRTPDMKVKEDDNTIPNESGNGLSNVRGTVAMARTGDPHSANSQFFINVGN